jgi:hypothetical protein
VGIEHLFCTAGDEQSGSLGVSELRGPASEEIQLFLHWFCRLAQLRGLGHRFYIVGIGRVV